MIMSNLSRDTPALAIDRVLCPVDFSEASQHAIEHALTIARWSGAAVSALHVCHPMFVPVTSGAGARFDDPDVEMTRLRSAAASLVDCAGAHDLKVDIAVEAGDPARQILEHADRHAVNLIVMGTHGATGFERLILQILRVAAETCADLIVLGVHGQNAADLMVFGSTANQVVRAAACPVLTVRQ